MYWQEQKHIYTEPLSPSATLIYQQEQTYTIQQTITPTEFITYWQEQCYVYSEVITPIGTSYHWFEELIEFVEFIETTRIESISYSWIESVAPPVNLALVLAAFAFVMAIVGITLASTRKRG
jgi:hypothetical protein